MLRDARGGGGTVMAVGDVERLGCLEGLGKRLERLAAGDRPNLVHGAVGGRGLEVGSTRVGRPGRGVVDSAVGAMGQHDRARMRAHGLDLAHPVVLLGRPRQLVLADRARCVSRDRCAARDAGLDVVAEGDAVDIERRLHLAPQHAGIEHAPHRRPGLGVGLVAVRVGAVGEVDLRARDVQERPGSVARHRARLLGAHHVVGRSGYLLCVGARDVQERPGSVARHRARLLGAHHVVGRSGYLLCVVRVRAQSAKRRQDRHARLNRRGGLGGLTG